MTTTRAWKRLWLLRMSGTHRIETQAELLTIVRSLCGLLRSLKSFPRIFSVLGRATVVYAEVKFPVTKKLLPNDIQNSCKIAGSMKSTYLCNWMRYHCALFNVTRWKRMRNLFPLHCTRVPEILRRKIWNTSHPPLLPMSKYQLHACDENCCPCRHF